MSHSVIILIGLLWTLRSHRILGPWSPVLRHDYHLSWPPNSDIFLIIINLIPLSRHHSSFWCSPDLLLQECFPNAFHSANIFPLSNSSMLQIFLFFFHAHEGGSAPILLIRFSQDVTAQSLQTLREMPSGSLHIMTNTPITRFYSHLLCVAHFFLTFIFLIKYHCWLWSM